MGESAKADRDTQEQLYDDANSLCLALWDNGALIKWKTANMLKQRIIELLERQAEITKRKTLHDNPMRAVNQPISDSDIWKVAYEIYCAGGYVDDGNEPNPPTDGIRELLDRQAEMIARKENGMSGGSTDRIRFRVEDEDIVLVGLCFKCPECGERIFLHHPDPFEMLSLHQTCMHWTCPECGKPIELTSEDILEKVYGNPVTYTGETTVRYPIVRENRGGILRDIRGFIDAVRRAVRKL